ncbi:DUF4955 domain-containing protein [Wenyingzhuangia aestuarii]|uniref:DUF4955 domain-containing protein n=1 Tax=Wenyingzhuangia aestuarii TaxID=1647582 RepID=UPI00143916E0|nr:DUF4955 domain-containing protein [Wenyingzhuangia aestuarii]NJB83976.1 hypothetical protein [Wenyingzhuangia aestuarii]
MNSRILFILILTCTSIFAQESKIWKQFIKAKQNKSEPILPDFSYAGYKYSETEIPTLHYKMFDVTHFGAIPNDSISDKNAIVKAIEAAEENGAGIIYFPKGKYFINTAKDELTSIFINSSKIIFRGESSENNLSTLFFEKDLPPTDPKKLWSCPHAITTKTTTKDTFISKVSKNAQRETFSIEIKDIKNLKVGDWIVLKMTDNDPKLIKQDLAGLEADPRWTNILNKGVQVIERHQIKKIKNNIITFYEPIHYSIDSKYNWEIYRYYPLHHIGFENLNFQGNWTKEFVHHRSAQDDGGWSILKLSSVVNSWVKNCNFINISNAIDFSKSAASTAINITISGKKGHSSVHANAGSTGILLAKINDLAGMHHTTGVAGTATTGTVIWKCKHADNTCFEMHASQPRCTLFDNVEGGFFAGRAGGAIQNLPNHGKYLVLWNYKETDSKEENFKFVATKSWYWRVVPPIIVGFHGSGTTFFKAQTQYTESIGTPVKPTSLFTEQLKFRLGFIPNWIP